MKRSILRRHMRWIASEEQNRPWLVEVWQPLLLAVWALLLWGAARGLMFQTPPQPEIDYVSFFRGRAEYLGDRTVRLTYDFEPSDDPSNPYAQLLDWTRSKGVSRGWLPGDVSLNVAFEDRVSVSFRFKIRKGSSIMPAVGVRGRDKLSFIAVQVDTDGRITVGKYLEGDREAGFSTRAPFRIKLNEEHVFRLEAREVVAEYDPRAGEEAARRLESELHPEMFGWDGTDPAEGDPVGDDPVDDGGGSEAVNGAADTADGGGPERLPAVHLEAWLDDFRILEHTVLKYELKGWIAFMSWGTSQVLYDDVVVEGRLFDAWVAKELRMQKILARWKQGRESGR